MKHNPVSTLSKLLLSQRSFTGNHKTQSFQFQTPPVCNDSGKGKWRYWGRRWRRTVRQKEHLCDSFDIKSVKANADHYLTRGSGCQLGSERVIRSPRVNCPPNPHQAHASSSPCSLCSWSCQTLKSIRLAALTMSETEVSAAAMAALGWHSRDPAAGARPEPRWSRWPAASSIERLY